MLAHEPAQARTLGAEHERDVAFGRGFGERAVALGGERDAPEAQPAEALERSRDVDHLDARHHVERA
jgi:hypothetical protein